MLVKEVSDKSAAHITLNKSPWKKTVSNCSTKKYRTKVQPKTPLKYRYRKRTVSKGSTTISVEFFSLSPLVWKFYQTYQENSTQIYH